MKDTQHLDQTHRRNFADERATRSSFPQVHQQFQSSSLQGRCGTPAKFDGTAFFRLSDDYFAAEAARSSLVDTGVFAALILAALLPIANGVQAVATLIHTAGVL